MLSRFAKVKQLHKSKSLKCKAIAQKQKLKCKRDNCLEDVLKGNIVSKTLVQRDSCSEDALIGVIVLASPKKKAHLQTAQRMRSRRHRVSCVKHAG